MAPPLTPALPRRVVILPAALTWAAAASTTVAFVAVGAVLDAARAGASPGAGTVATLIGALVVAAVSAYLGSHLSLDGVGRREGERRDVLLRQLFRLGVTFRTQQRSGRFVSTATDGVERAAFYESTFIGPMVASLTVPLIAMGVLGATVDWVVAGWLALAVPGIPVLVGGFQRVFRTVSSEYRATGRRFAAQFLDGLQGLPTSTAFNRAEAKGAELARAAEELRRQVMRLLAGNQLVLLIVDSAFSLGMVTAAAGLAMARLRDGALTPGQAISVVLVSTVLLEPLDRIGQFFYVGMGGRAAVREIEAVLSTVPDVVDAEGVEAPGARTPATTASSRERPAAAAPDGAAGSALALERVEFAYPGGNQVLDDLSLTVPVGGRVALIGPSGSGKTTVTALLQGHLRPTSGTVRVGGHDLSATPLDWAREQLSVVAQSTYLFTGTLADNLRLADPDADDDRLWDALAEANLADHVRGLPDGLATRVGERGLSLSGGQAQRVAVARALLKDAPVLVLDEPTSQVDAASEAALVEALERAGRGRTVLVVAHRLTTVRDVDEVVVLVDGRVVEQGPPQALQGVDSYYARAVDLTSTAGATR